MSLYVPTYTFFVFLYFRETHVFRGLLRWTFSVLVSPPFLLTTSLSSLLFWLLLLISLSSFYSLLETHVSNPNSLTKLLQNFISKYMRVILRQEVKDSLNITNILQRPKPKHKSKIKICSISWPCLNPVLDPPFCLAKNFNASSLTSTLEFFRTSMSPNLSRFFQE